MTPTERIQRAYDECSYAEGRAWTRLTGIERGGLPQSGGAIRRPRTPHASPPISDTTLAASAGSRLNAAAAFRPVGPHAMPSRGGLLYRLAAATSPSEGDRATCPVWQTSGGELAAVRRDGE